MIVPLQLEIDENAVRASYDEYVGDVAYYKAAGELTADHPDQGYRTGVPETFEEYLAGWADGVIGDVVGDHFSYRITRPESRARELEAVSPTGRAET